MSRPPRIVVPETPLHITQRGVDRGPTFLFDEDFAFYLAVLADARVESGCAVHAYALMTNHVHLLITPSQETSPARMMCTLGRRYVRYFNEKYRRTGTLWEGRYRSALVDSTHYLFACSRYIEMNPVRANLVAEPRAYEWSSHRHNAWGDDDRVVTPHSHYASLGAGRDARCAAYRAMFGMEIPAGDLARLRAAQAGRPSLQPTPYRQAIEAAFGPAVVAARSDPTFVTPDSRAG